MAASAITDQFAMDMNLTRTRYNELIIAEHDLMQLKNVLEAKCKSGYQNLTHDEIKFLCTIVFGAETVAKWTEN